MISTEYRSESVMNKHGASRSCPSRLAIKTLKQIQCIMNQLNVLQCLNTQMNHKEK